MNTINFNKNDYPLTTDTYDFLQSASQLIEKIAGAFGDNYVISGCVQTGGSVSSGYVCVGGEIMPFAGGAVQTYVRVVSTATEFTIQDATRTETTKALVFGAGSGQIEWSTFKRAPDMLAGILAGGGIANIAANNDAPIDFDDDISYAKIIRDSSSVGGTFNLPKAVSRNKSRIVFFDIETSDSSVTLYEKDTAGIYTIPTPGENYTHKEQVILISTGTAWKKVNANPPQWQDLALQSVFTATNLRVREKQNNIVELNAQELYTSDGADAAFTTIPADLRPEFNQRIPIAGDNNSTYHLLINASNGNVSIDTQDEFLEFTFTIRYLKP